MSAAVIQSGAVTVNHVATWGWNGVIQDGGSASEGVIGEIGITNSTGAPAFGINNGPTTGPFSAFTIAVSPSGVVTFGANSYGGASATSVLFDINGITYPFPGPGSGTVIGPDPVVNNNAVTWNGTSGTLIKDAGGPPYMGPEGAVSTAGQMIQVGGGGVISPHLLVVNRENSTQLDQDMIVVNSTINDLGTPGQTFYAETIISTVTFENIYSGGVFVNGPGSGAIAVNAGIDSSAAQTSSDTANSSEAIALWFDVQRSADPNFTATTEQTYAPMWAAIINYIDRTNLAAPVAGNMQTEWSMYANNMGPGFRNPLSMNLGNYFNAGAGIAPVESNTLLLINSPGGEDSFTGMVRAHVKPTGNYGSACLDVRSGTPIQTTVLTSLGSPSTTLYVHNIYPFISQNEDLGTTSPSNPMPIFINGNPYTCTGFGFSGSVNGAQGYITTQTAVSTTDGSAGNTVIGNANAIWLLDGQTIQMSYYGYNQLWYQNGDFNFGDPTEYISLNRGGISVGGSNNPNGNISVESSGTGQITVGSATYGTAFAVITPSANIVNHLTVSGAETGFYPTITAFGSDSVVDLELVTPQGVVYCVNGALINGACGFFTATPVGRQTVTGSKGGNAALASLISKLATFGLITDSTS